MNCDFSVVAVPEREIETISRPSLGRKVGTITQLQVSRLNTQMCGFCIVFNISEMRLSGQHWPGCCYLLGVSFAGDAQEITHDKKGA